MPAYYNEIDPYCVEWLRNLIAAGHLPAGDVDERPIQEVSADDLEEYNELHFFAGIGGWPLALQYAGWEGPVWTGSCPCQPLSSAGQRRGHVDERHLWPAFHALIAERRPATVFGEQVASKDGREWLAGVRADLEHLGYAVGAADLPAAGVGAPHIRGRLFWVAHSDGPGMAGPQREQQSLRVESATASARRGDNGLLAGLSNVSDPTSAHCIDGLSRVLAGAIVRAYGNAIVPQVGAAFVSAFAAQWITPTSQHGEDMTH